MYVWGRCRQFVREMQSMCWGDAVNLWGRCSVCVGEMPSICFDMQGSVRRRKVVSGEAGHVGGDAEQCGEMQVFVLMRQHDLGVASEFLVLAMHPMQEYCKCIIYPFGPNKYL